MYMYMCIYIYIYIYIYRLVKEKYFGCYLLLLILFYNNLSHVQVFMIHNFFEIKQYLG